MGEAIQRRIKTGMDALSHHWALNFLQGIFVSLFLSHWAHLFLHSLSLWIWVGRGGSERWWCYYTRPEIFIKDVHNHCDTRMQNMNIFILATERE